jgi:hypothetical protein
VISKSSGAWSWKIHETLLYWSRTDLWSFFIQLIRRAVVSKIRVDLVDNLQIKSNGFSITDFCFSRYLLISALALSSEVDHISELKSMDKLLASDTKIENS